MLKHVKHAAGLYVKHVDQLFEHVASAFHYMYIPTCVVFIVNFLLSLLVKPCESIAYLRWLGGIAILADRAAGLYFFLVLKCPLYLFCLFLRRLFLGRWDHEDHDRFVDRALWIELGGSYFPYYLSWLKAI